jgi:pyridoxal phosphate enzyme (YggS family)
LSLDRKVEITSNLSKVKEQIADAAKASDRVISDIKLIAVTKNFPVADLQILYDLGVRDFGENRDQEASEKVGKLPSDITWHFQGGIQSNKLKSIASWASYIHSVDQTRSAQLISDYSPAKVRSVFIQISLDQIPESRGGIDPVKLPQISDEISQMPNIKLMGLMAVAPLDQGSKEAFDRMAKYSSVLIKSHPQATGLSIGMSGDFQEAIKHGATHLRIGSSILGNRNPLI